MTDAVDREARTSESGSNGYYLMARGWRENPIFKSEPYTEREGWEWLIENARYRAGRCRAGSFVVDLQRGQLCASTRFMAQAWKWSEAKVRRFLSKLKADAMIDAQTDAGINVITVCNYDRYQITPDKIDAAGDAGNDAAATQDRRSSDANKNEGNKGNESLSVASPQQPVGKRPKAKRATYPEHPHFQEFWDEYPRRLGTNDRKPAAAAYTRAVNGGADPDEILRGLRGYAALMRKDGKEGTGYVRQATTFLNQETWRSFLIAEVREAEPSPSKAAYHAAFRTWVDGGRVGPQPVAESFAHLDQERAA